MDHAPTQYIITKQSYECYVLVDVLVRYLSFEVANRLYNNARKLSVLRRRKGGELCDNSENHRCVASSYVASTNNHDMTCYE